MPMTGVSIEHYQKKICTRVAVPRVVNGTFSSISVVSLGVLCLFLLKYDHKEPVNNVLFIIGLGVLYSPPLI